MRSLILQSGLFLGLAAASPCGGIVGPAYPSPLNVSNKDSAMSKAWQNMTQMLDSLASGATKPDLAVGEHTFSVGAFSAVDPDAAKVFQYHHTAASVANASTGTRRADGDSVYRIASVSKLLTVYLALVEGGSALWDRPIGDFIPELAAAPTPDPGSVDRFDWTNVTLGALAGQMAGMPRVLSNGQSDISVSLAALGVDPMRDLGLPPLNQTERPVCDLNATTPCTRDQYVAAIADRQPVYKPWTTPIYSNVGYDMIGLALENMTGQPFADLLQSRLAGPLGLPHTTAAAPRDVSNAVIPNGDVDKSSFGQAFGYQTPNGGMYSTLNDLSALGASILNSTLLSDVDTREWLKPVSHTALLTGSVGRPWEIKRFTQPVPQRVNDLYTKEGDLGQYSSYLILSPDHSAGFTVLAAGPSTTVLVNALGDMLTQTALQGLEADAAGQAATNIGGTYADESTNSTLTLSVDAASGGGVAISAWTARGRDILASLKKINTVTSARLLPTDLGSARPGVAGTRAFRSAFDVSEFGTAAPTGVFTEGLRCGTWNTLDAATYGKIGVDEFVVEMDEQGRATAVNVAAWRMRMTRK